MTTIQELNGAKLRKALGLEGVVKTYHNKHTDGSGNFGFVLREIAKDGQKDGGWFSLSVHYDSTGTIRNLRIAPYISAGPEIYHDSLGHIVEQIAKFVREYQRPEWVR